MLRPASAMVLPVIPLPEQEFFNGTGGFADNGREYVTVLHDGHRNLRGADRHQGPDQCRKRNYNYVRNTPHPQHRGFRRKNLH